MKKNAERPPGPRAYIGSEIKTSVINRAWTEKKKREETETRGQNELENERNRDKKKRIVRKEI